MNAAVNRGARRIGTRPVHVGRLTGAPTHARTTAVVTHIKRTRACRLSRLFRDKTAVGDGRVLVLPFWAYSRLLVTVRVASPRHGRGRRGDTGLSVGRTRSSEDGASSWPCRGQLLFDRRTLLRRSSRCSAVAECVGPLHHLTIREPLRSQDAAFAGRGGELSQLEVVGYRLYAGLEIIEADLGEKAVLVGGI